MKMYPKTRALLWLRCLVSGEKCIACGEMNTKGEGLLCPECEDELKKAHFLICPECSAFARDCLCPSRIMRENRVEFLIKYAFYDAQKSDEALNRIIRRLKRIPDRLTFAYFAAVLSKPLTSLSEARGFDAENTVVTYIPRSKKMILRDGYDQARLFAKSVGRRMNYSVQPLFVRLKHGKQQKYLHIDERIENVKGMFAPSQKYSAAGKNVIIVDDLVTTGATVSEAARILYSVGANDVVCLCMAKSELRRGDNMTVDI
jgi:ComF family protein